MGIPTTSFAYAYEALMKVRPHALAESPRDRYVPMANKFLAKETKGLTARQRTKKVEKSGGKTHTENRRASDIQEMKDTIPDTTRRAPPSPSFYHALSRYSARSPAPIAAFDCARYNERAGLLLGTTTTQRPTKLALPSSKTGR